MTPSISSARTSRTVRRVRPSSTKSGTERSMYSRHDLMTASFEARKVSVSLSCCDMISELDYEVRDVDGVDFGFFDRRTRCGQQLFAEHRFTFDSENLLRLLAGQDGEHGVANLGRKERVGFGLACFGKAYANGHAQVAWFV